jgi:transposase
VEASINNCSIIYIGLDTHKTFTQLAVLKDERGAKPDSLGKINTNKATFIKLSRQLQSQYPKATLHFIYEADPCGYWIYWLFTSLGHCCYIIALSLIPKKPGKKIKTDKRDVANLLGI